MADVPEVPLTQKALFAYGQPASGFTSVSNLVNSSGVVASDTTGVGSARGWLGGATYGIDKAIFGFGTTGSATGITNLVNSSGVVGSNVSAVGTARTLSAQPLANNAKRTIKNNFNFITISPC